MSLILVLTIPAVMSWCIPIYARPSVFQRVQCIVPVDYLQPMDQCVAVPQYVLTEAGAPRLYAVQRHPPRTTEVLPPGPWSRRKETTRGVSFILTQQ